MPLDKYFRGSGEKVMKSMKKQYGDKKGESVFYATANKEEMKPGKKKRPKLFRERPEKLSPPNHMFGSRG